HEFSQFAAQIAPAPLNVLNKRLRLVLREHGDLPDPGVHAIRENEIDDAKLAAERRRRLATMLGQRLEAFAAPTRHDHRQSAAGESADIASGVGPSSVSHTFPRSPEVIRAWPEPKVMSVPYEGLRAPAFSARHPMLDSAFVKLAR